MGCLTSNVLGQFVLNVVGDRRESPMRSRKTCGQEDFSAHLERWSRPDFIPPSPLLRLGQFYSINSSAVPPSLADVDAQFLRAWLLFCWRGNLVLLLLRLLRRTLNTSSFVARSLGLLGFFLPC